MLRLVVGLGCTLCAVAPVGGASIRPKPGLGFKGPGMPRNPEHRHVISQVGVAQCDFTMYLVVWEGNKTSASFEHGITFALRFSEPANLRKATRASHRHLLLALSVARIHTHPT